MKYETIDAAQIQKLMDREEPGPPADWDGDDSQGGAASSQRDDSSNSSTSTPDVKDEGGDVGKDDGSDHDKEDGSIDDGAPSGLH